MKLTKLFKSITFLTFCLLVALPQLTFAINFSVSPLIIDIEAEPRDTFTYDIKLKNNESRYLRLYASVNEIELGDTNEIKEFITPSMSDRTSTVTSWLEITRGRIELVDNEEKEIPLTVRINQNAKPGLYHAFVGFSSGSNRDIAQQSVIDGQGSGVILRIQVGSKQEEFLRLVSFTTDRFSFGPDKGLMTYVIENTGDVPLTPVGDIVIYDGKGKELTNLTIESDSTLGPIEPGTQRTYTEKLPFTDRLGRNKAFLTIEYGETNRAAVYDTNFYFSIPWTYLLIIMILLTVVFAALVLILRRGEKTNDYDPHEAHDLPFFVGKSKDHSEYEHDIDLKKKDS